MAQRAQTMHYKHEHPFVYTVDVNGRKTAKFVQAYLHGPDVTVEWTLLNQPVATKLDSGEVVLLLILQAVKTPKTVAGTLEQLEITLTDTNESLPPITQPPSQPVAFSNQGPCDFCTERAEGESPLRKKRSSTQPKTSSKQPRSR
jgi:hypothetical protein